jgi:hypothetical protein
LRGQEQYSNRAYIHTYIYVCIRAWTAFAELEQSLGELERARAIFELGVEQPLLDMPEVCMYVCMRNCIGKEL